MNSTKKLYLAIISILLSVIAINVAIATNNIKKNDQELTITTDARGCVDEVVLASAVDNCEGTQFASNCGKNGKDCICMQSQKFVSWTTENNARFEIIFNGTNPFTHNCNLKSGNNQKLRCKIDAPDADYDYDVVLESCPDDRYDPRIVVRTRG